MSWLLTIVWVALKVVGVLAAVAAFLLYEDEEGRLQNRLELWWVTIDDKRNAALSWTAAFLQGIAIQTRAAFDRIFGSKPVSMQIFGVSFWLSLASVSLVAVLTSLVTSQNGKLQFVWLTCSCVLMALVPAFAPYRWLRVLWYGVLVWMFVNFFDFTLFVYQRGDSHLASRILIYVAIAEGVSFVCDVIYIALTRWSLQNASQAVRDRQVYACIALIGVAIILFFVLLIGPIFVGLRVARHSLVVGGAILLCFGLNSISLLTTLLMAIIAILLLVHRVFWPMLQRPLYALQRYDILKNKVALWAVALVLILLPRPQTFADLWKVLMEKLQK
jgi:hypothetical protein